ncbi:hypothetical protein K4F52_002189 [Lecanicillium sp. MT-2017a]|nr:hypothetical protein K4F52_002189 [Lecanicillium sp. MT-2017a]
MSQQSRDSMFDVADTLRSQSTTATSPETALETDPKPATQGVKAEKPTETNHIEIPKITPIFSPKESSVKLAQGLEGKFVDEFGNILGADGTVHGRVEGDLPAMVGRPIQSDGSVLSVDGEACGYVSENLTAPPLQEVGGGLKVDAEGNIYDMHGETVGKMKNPTAAKNTNPSTSEKQTQNDFSRKRKASHSSPGGHEGARPRPRPATPSPSEVYLDVKSTHNGIQLIIKIPTVFNRD